MITVDCNNKSMGSHKHEVRVLTVLSRKTSTFSKPIPFAQLRFPAFWSTPEKAGLSWFTNAVPFKVETQFLKLIKAVFRTVKCSSTASSATFTNAHAVLISDSLKLFAFEFIRRKSFPASFIILTYVYIYTVSMSHVCLYILWVGQSRYRTRPIAWRTSKYITGKRWLFIRWARTLFRIWIFPLRIKHIRQSHMWCWEFLCTSLTEKKSL